MTKSLHKLLLTLSLIPSLALAAGRGQSSEGIRSVSAGIAFSAVSHFLYVNPASLPDSTKFNFEGLYMFDPQDVNAAVTTSFGPVGLGADYRYSNAGADTIGGGFGVKLWKFALGGTVATQTPGGGVDGNVGLTIDFPVMRLAAVARSLSGGIDRVDAGLGFKFSLLSLEFDVKKQLTPSSDQWLFDAGLVVDFMPVSVGFGYAFGTMGYQGTLHAGLGVYLGKNVIIEAHYRPSPQELDAGDVAAGLRVVF